MLKFDVILTPTEEEILDGLHRADLRRASKARLIVQTAVLWAVAAWSVIAFFGDGMQTASSLFIGIVAIALCGVMWLVPPMQMKHTASELAQSDTKPHMWVFEDGLDFASEPPDHAYFDFSSVRASHPKEDAALQTLVLRFQNDDVIVVPKRQLTEEQWNWLLSAIADQRRH